MTSMPATAAPPSNAELFDLERETRLASAAALIRAHRTERAETEARLDRAERHIIVASLRAGHSKSRIAELFQLKSRTRIDRLIADAITLGEVTAEEIASLVDFPVGFETAAGAANVVATTD